MSSSLFEARALPSSEITCSTQEDGDSRDSGISSGRQSPEPENSNSSLTLKKPATHTFQAKLTSTRTNRNEDAEFSSVHDEWDPEILYGELLEVDAEKSKTDRSIFDTDRPEKAMLSRRIPLAERRNNSDSSQGSHKSTPRGAKLESPAVIFPKTQYLSATMFDSDELTMDQRTISMRTTRSSNLSDSVDDSFMSISTTSSQLILMSALPPPVFRRTMSEFVDRPCRKRSSDSVTESDRKRSRAVVIPLEDDNLDDSVFLPDDCSPNTTIGSVSSHPSRSVTRAASCGVLEMGEHHAHSPALPKMTEVHYSLPYVAQPQKDSQAFRSISAATLAAELRSLGDEVFRDKYTLVDCRYDYEYEGGHVKTAINVYDQNLLEDLFFPESHMAPIRQRIPIFYCEFSQKRGPGMAHHLRSLDRRRNELNYPEVDYKEIYLLDHGYQRFWKDGAQDLCEPSSYVPMREKEHHLKLNTFVWHKSRSAYNLGKSRLTSGSDAVMYRSRRGALFSRHHSLMQVDHYSEEGLTRLTPSSSRTRSMLSLDDDGEDVPLAQARVKLAFDSPDKS